LNVPEWTYDLSAKPNTDDFIFVHSRGLGYGSELSLSRNSGLGIETLYQDPSHYISFARYSPDGSLIAFIKIPDSPTPFTVGELWVMDADGSNPRQLAEADAGHGYAANWSPDGRRIAFVKRENPENESANQSTESLISNIYVVEIAPATLTQITQLSDGRTETPQWSPDSNTLTFNTVRNGRIEVQIADIHSGQIRSVATESTCCPAWMRK
jgi:Tol biopolymer transport system component